MKGVRLKTLKQEKKFKSQKTNKTYNGLFCYNLIRRGDYMKIIFSPSKTFKKQTTKFYGTKPMFEDKAIET